MMECALVLGYSFILDVCLLWNVYLCKDQVCVGMCIYVGMCMFVLVHVYVLECFRVGLCACVEMYVCV